MSQSLIDLQRLLAGRQTTTERVVVLNGGMVRVSTVQGVVEVTARAVLQSGDRVMVCDGRTIKSQVSTQVPLFYT